MDILTPTVVGGFDTEPDEFSDFERLRTALPASGSSTGECPPSRLSRDHRSRDECSPRVGPSCLNSFIELYDLKKEHFNLLLK